MAHHGFLQRARDFKGPVVARPSLPVHFNGFFDRAIDVQVSRLRQRLRDAVQTLLALKGESQLLSSNDVLDQSMKVRKPYLLPLHLLQAELMKRRRAYLADRQAENTPVDHALMVSIAGIAAGMRNTG